MLSIIKRGALGAASFVLAAMLAACTSMGPPVVIHAAFDPAAASVINIEGRAHVSGQAFVRQNDGKVLRALGTDVYLIPKTPYADERMAALYGTGDKLKWGPRPPEEDPRYRLYMRKTVATSGGSFSFDRVADGDYYIVAMIFMPGGFTGTEFPILERVSVHDGRSVKVVMRGY